MNIRPEQCRCPRRTLVEPPLPVNIAAGKERNMETSFIIEKVAGKKKVRITNNKYGLELYTMMNGFQWSGQPVDDGMLSLIKEAIEEYLK